MRIIVLGLFSGLMLPVVGVGLAVVGLPWVIIGRTKWMDRIFDYFGAHWDRYVEWAHDRGVPDPDINLVVATFFFWVAIFGGGSYIIVG